MSKSWRMAPRAVGMPLLRRLTLLLVITALATGAVACAQTPEGESRISGVSGGADDQAGGNPGRLSPTAGLEGGASGGQRPGEGSSAGLDGLTGGLGGGSGGSDPSAGVPADLAALPGADAVLALVSGTLTKTYTIDYAVQPKVMDHMVVSNEQGRQSVHSLERDGSQRWLLYEGVKATIDCKMPASRAWQCERIWSGGFPDLLSPRFDPQSLTVGLGVIPLSPVLVLAVLAPPLQGSAGTPSDSYRTTIAGASAQCLKYETQGRPPAEICANADAVPVRLSTSVATGVGSVPIVLEAQSYSAGVDPNAFTPPAPV